jgi:hypothetical protein
MGANRISGVSPAAGLKNGQFNRQRNCEKANPPEADKYRILNVEYPISNVEGSPSKFCGSLFDIRYFQAVATSHQNTHCVWGV